MPAVRDGWMITFSGMQFFPLEPDPGSICIEDIAHALSNICRFGGHVREFYSVAQHSVWVSYHVPRRTALHALLHDAAEAYLGDIVRPLKRGLPDFEQVEQIVMATIYERFGLGPLPFGEDLRDIKSADGIALMTERRDLLARTPAPWVEDEARYQPADGTIRPLRPLQARREFLNRFRELRKMGRVD